MATETYSLPLWCDAQGTETEHDLKWMRDGQNHVAAKIAVCIRCGRKRPAWPSAPELVEAGAPDWLVSL